MISHKEKKKIIDKNFQNKVKFLSQAGILKEINYFNSQNKNKIIIHTVNNKNCIISMIIKILKLRNISFEKYDIALFYSSIKIFLLITLIT